MGSFSVSASARSVAESSPGILGLALGSRTSGALELLDGRTSKVITTVALPAPARYVTLGSDGTTFYVLSGLAALRERRRWSTLRTEPSGALSPFRRIPSPSPPISRRPSLRARAQRA